MPSKLGTYGSRDVPGKLGTYGIHDAPTNPTHHRMVEIETIPNFAQPAVSP